ncbi:hypothetical protein [Pseudoalteromonas luteoviolacea]|uniref:Uncharacterized protein n=1 Tax=Pseudoalteromonas luteoviolacea S4060-1 TaxID=1365257 RepID=A0A162BWS9_9GAMM|nr:hypothetical protein [Pseudoalteromonas luteoviolacea]KZN70396.1 hypothetical protein N478_00400 [Pseudoalteromonas luteoviolacea S4060-1]
MEKVVSLESHLDMWMTDTCNRYLNVLTELGVVDKKKVSKLSKQILGKRNEMLDEYIPIFIEETFKLLENKDVETKKI